jgi:hypothetical protein
VIKKIIELYQSGMTQREVGETLGITQKVVFTRLRKSGVKCRKAAVRYQNGSANKNWKGSNAGYQAFHRRLDATRGRPKKCEMCGTDDPNKHYDWASMTKWYDNPEDYKRLCRSCHFKLDQVQRNFKGAIGGRPR